VWRQDRTSAQSWRYEFKKEKEISFFFLLLLLPKKSLLSNTWDVGKRKYQGPFLRLLSWMIGPDPLINGH
jgi:hypothetical protein